MKSLWQLELDLQLLHPQKWARFPPSHPLYSLVYEEEGDNELLETIRRSAHLPTPRQTTACPYTKGRKSLWEHLEDEQCALRSNIPSLRVDAETPWSYHAWCCWRCTLRGTCRALAFRWCFCRGTFRLLATWHARCSSCWVPCHLLNHQTQRERLKRW